MSFYFFYTKSIISVKMLIPLTWYGELYPYLLVFVWRQLESAFFGAMTSVVALFVFARTLLVIISFFGHADFPKSSEYRAQILAALEENIKGESAHMYLGGYGDFDAMAYECCKIYKNLHCDTTLVYVTPYITENYQKNHLQYIRCDYDEIIYPSIEEKPLRFAITYRNKWMVEQADLLICGVSHNWGGAYQAYTYAKRKRKRIINITGKDI